jgi:hypothetical protein
MHLVRGKASISKAVILDMNIYVKQSNTTLKDVNKHRATCYTEGCVVVRHK